MLCVCVFFLQSVHIFFLAVVFVAKQNVLIICLFTQFLFTVPHFILSLSFLETQRSLARVLLPYRRQQYSAFGLQSLGLNVYMYIFYTYRANVRLFSYDLQKKKPNAIYAYYSFATHNPKLKGRRYIRNAHNFFSYAITIRCMNIWAHFELRRNFCFVGLLNYFLFGLFFFFFLLSGSLFSANINFSSNANVAKRYTLILNLWHETDSQIKRNTFLNPFISMLSQSSFSVWSVIRSTLENSVYTTMNYAKPQKNANYILRIQSIIICNSLFSTIDAFWFIIEYARTMFII